MPISIPISRCSLLRFFMLWVVLSLFFGWPSEASLKGSLDLPEAMVSEPQSLGQGGAQCAWQSDFDSTGPSSTVWATAVYDDGGGEALYVAGSFETLGDEKISLVAKWDGSTWSSVGGGIKGYGVADLEVFDDGSGPALFATGWFWEAGGISVESIAKWNGQSWQALPDTYVLIGRSMEIFDDGTGPSLVVSAIFVSDGDGVNAEIAGWDGGAWSALAVDAGDRAVVLETFDDGSGPALFAGGRFETIEGVSARGIAKWDGKSWSAMGDGFFGSDVRALAVYDDGGGPALYAGGDFPFGSVPDPNGIAKWNGSSWDPLGEGVDGTVQALTVHDFGDGARLYAGGNFGMAGGVEANNLATWDGSSWQALGAGVDRAVNTLAIFDDGIGEVLYAGGGFGQSGDLVANRLAKWDGSDWNALEAPGQGNGLNQDVLAFAIYDDGTGPALYAAGWFTLAGNEPMSRIVRWRNGAWEPVGGGINGPVNALVVLDHGDGAELIAGGDFTKAGGAAAGNIARWNGSFWQPLGAGPNDEVQALAVYDDGSGPALYAGGGFTSAGGEPANYVAKWDGASWSALGSGLGSGVDALAVYDGGDGAKLYVGGYLQTAGGLSVNGIASWDGSSWAAVGSGLDSENSTVLDFVVMEEDETSVLVVAGRFLAAGGVPAEDIATWNGSEWAPLGPTDGHRFEALAVFDEGNGPRLFATDSASPDPNEGYNRGLFKWTGSAWQPVAGSRMNGTGRAMISYDDGDGPSLFVGGWFTATEEHVSNYVAEYSCADVWIFSDGFESGDLSAWSAD